MSTEKRVIIAVGSAFVTIFTIIVLTIIALVEMHGL
jgi:hypothetical protein